jgi:hypothetical protein
MDKFTRNPPALAVGRFKDATIRDTREATIVLESLEEDED